jgi:dTDP-4-amino-4,6-dideoxygalactose transaminase
VTRPATEAEVQAVLDTLRSGWLTMGPRTQAFEAAFAEWTGAEHAVAVGSATAAIHLSLLGAGVTAGDEVAVPALGPRALAEAPRWCGAEPRFYDDGALPEIGSKTRAVVAFGLWGRLLPLGLAKACEAAEVPLLSDAGGDLVFHSLDEGAPVSVGTGGMVTTDDAERAARVRSLRGHALTSGTWDRHRGHSAGYDVVDIGFNYRMDEARAALGTARLAAVGDELARRSAAAAHYAQNVPTAGAGVLLFAGEAERDAAAAALTAAGISSTVVPLLADLPAARELAARTLAVTLDADPERVLGLLASD